MTRVRFTEDIRNIYKRGDEVELENRMAQLMVINGYAVYLKERASIDIPERRANEKNNSNSANT